MLTEYLKEHKVILASQSPRRHNLLQAIGIDFDIMVNHDQEEAYPANLSKDKIPEYLARHKSMAVMGKMPEKTILITADTIVWFNNKIVNKPRDARDAVKMLEELSGNCHEVITGVCLRSDRGERTFRASTLVYFVQLTRKEIEWYVENFKPFDKAGAYGIQEWIGYVGVEKIEGSYFNVMGLPIQKLYHELIEFLK